MIYFYADDVIQRVQMLAESNNITLHQALVKCGSKDFVANLRKGIKPSIQKFISIANFFSVGLDYLITGDISNASSITTAEDIELLSSFQKLDKDSKMLVLERVHSLLELKERSQKDGKKATSTHQMQSKTSLEAKELVEERVYEQSASAGLGNYLYEDSPHEILTFNREDIPAKTNFGIRIQGDSMEPEIMDGSIVWVRERRQIETGKIGIFIYNNEAYCKKLHLDYENKKVYLVSINEKYPPIEIEDENFLKTVGEVLN